MVNFFNKYHIEYREKLFLGEQNDSTRKKRM